MFASVPAACPSLRATALSKGSGASSFRVIEPPIATFFPRFSNPCYERNPGARPGLPELAQERCIKLQSALSAALLHRISCRRTHEGWEERPSWEREHDITL